MATASNDGATACRRKFTDHNTAATTDHRAATDADVLGEYVGERSRGVYRIEIVLRSLVEGK